MKFGGLLSIAMASMVIAEESKGYFKLDYNIKRGNENRYNQRFTKRENFELTIENAETYYVADLKLGSNEEPVQVLLDTGSSDLWVMASDVDCFNPSTYKKRENTEQKRGLGVGPLALPDSGTKFSGLGSSLNPVLKANKVQQKAATTMDCLALGSFATGKSDSWKANDTDDSYFYISYADGTEALGVWGTDKVFLQDSEVNGLSFAVANTSSSDVGVLGIGLSTLEITNVYADYLEFDAYTYENLPLKMKSEGLIKKAAYSMYLNDVDEDKGSVLFGAIDKKKFKGDLETFEITRGSSDSGERLQIELDSIKVENSKGKVSSKLNSYTVTTLLDTGSTLSYLPSSVLDSVTESMNLTYSSYYGAYYINCKAKGWSVNFQFGSTEIKVPIEELVWEVPSVDSCFFGIFENSDSTATLGDNFIRQAYVVYDLEDKTISLAEVNHSDDTDIETISDSFGSGVSDDDSESSSSSSESTSSSESASSSASATNSSASASSTSLDEPEVSGGSLLNDEDDDNSPGNSSGSSSSDNSSSGSSSSGSSSSDGDDEDNEEKNGASGTAGMLSSTSCIFASMLSFILLLQVL